MNEENKNFRSFKILSISLLVLTICLIIFALPKGVEASEPSISQKQEIVNGTVKSTIRYANGQEYSIVYGNEVKSLYSTSDISNYLVKKGWSIVSILQDLASPFCTICFIVGAAITLLGILTGNSGRGILTMMGSGFAYTSILYAPMIINCFVIILS